MIMLSTMVIILVSSHNINLIFTPALRLMLLSTCYHESYGSQGVKCLIQRFKNLSHWSQDLDSGFDSNVCALVPTITSTERKIQHNQFASYLCLIASETTSCPKKMLKELYIVKSDWPLKSLAL